MTTELHRLYLKPMLSQLLGKILKSCSPYGISKYRLNNKYNVVGQNRCKDIGSMVTKIGKYRSSSVKHILHNGQLTRDGVLIIYKGMISYKFVNNINTWYKILHATATFCNCKVNVGKREKGKK